jgi:hypothetical protein
MRLVNNKKLNFWGAVASIIGLPLAVVLYWMAQPMTASSQSQPRAPVSTTGDQSPAIGSNTGTIIINYDAPAKGKSAVLRHSSRGGVPMLFDLPSIDAISDPKHHLCSVLAGTSAMLTGRKADMGVLKDYWREVMITAGDCASKVGWAMSQNLNLE